MSDNLLPSEELFDVVDELDQVLYPLARSQVHRQRLRHRAVHIFLFRSDGCLLIHQRSSTKEEFPSVWTSSASGHVSAGEGYDESAQRELQEELGVTAELRAIMKFDACPDTSNEFTVLYEAFSDSIVTPDLNEMQAVRWMSPADISDWMAKSPEDFSPAFRLLFPHRT
ncbi:MAG: NUDIX hydrolase [Planctomyces sp.]